MTNRLTDRCRPECDHRNAASIAAFHGFAHQVRLRRSAYEFLDVVLAPVITGSLKRPHVIRLGFGAYLPRVEAVLLHEHLADGKIRCSHILIPGADQRHTRKIIIGLKHQCALDRNSGRGQRTRGDFYAFATSEFPAGFEHPGLREVGNEIKLLALAYGLMPDVASLLTTPGEELVIS